MTIETDITKPYCQFEHCRYYDEGKCLNQSARKDCIEMALCVLNTPEFIEPNAYCDFCADYSFAKDMINAKCEKYNQRDKVARANAHVGVLFNTYITDGWKRVREKHSRTYKLNYCPVCGRLLRSTRFGKKRGKKSEL